MDPVRFGGGTCALPQLRGSGPTTFDYDMGGSDGQLIKVDPANDHIYLTFPCVGYHADPAKLPEFVIDPNNKINQTLVLMSDNAGSSWKSLGYIGQIQWRFGVVPIGTDELAFGFLSSVATGKLNHTTGKYEFDSTGSAAPEGQSSWMGWWDLNNSNIPLTKDHANVFGHPLVTRTPDTKSLLLAFPDKSDKGYGYRLFFYDRANKLLLDPAEPIWILPATGDQDDIAFHLSVADPGKGDVLLYWEDLDSSAKTITVRGRLITSNRQFSQDFTISRVAGADYSFSLPSKYWIGDYYTASGLVRSTGQVAGKAPFTIDLRTTRYDYYPMWVEPDGQVHYTKVEYAVEPGLLSKGPRAKITPLKLITVPANRWKPEPPPVEFSRIPHPTAPRTMREPDMRETQRGVITRPVRPQ